MEFADSDNNDNNMIYVGALYFIIGPSPMFSSPSWSLAVLAKGLDC
jgi:hypothetical protein